MAVSLALDITMILPLGAGFILFTWAAMKKGFSLKQILGFAAGSLKESFIVIRIMLLIGCLTGIWRLSGTVAYFVTFGLSVIPPSLFLPAVFLLAAAMSFALGTSFGVTATAGVILISIARAGGVNPVIAAGAVLSGVYVGDRGSPAASSGNLVAVLTKTDMRENVRAMLKCSVVPFLICLAAYLLLSVKTSIQAIDASVTDSLSAEFTLSWYCIIPAVIMIALPFCSVSISLSMCISLVSAAAVGMLVQHRSLWECVRAMLLGFSPNSPELESMLAGGGIVSMLEVCGILLISCSFGDIFRETGLISGLNRRIRALSDKIGRFPAMIILSVIVSAVFCNQTVGAIMQNTLSGELYGDSREERFRKMLDMENSVITIAGTVPWCIACSVPLTMLGADARSVLFGFYLWLIPLWWLITGRKRKT